MVYAAAQKEACRDIGSCTQHGLFIEKKRLTGGELRVLACGRFNGILGGFHTDDIYV